MDEYYELFKKAYEHENNKTYNTYIRKSGEDRYEGGLSGIDREDYHIVIDDIYKKFIKDISNGKLNKMEDIKKISDLINEKIIKKNISLWYS